MLEISKECTTCHSLKPLTAQYFHKDIKRLSGFQSTCKQCRNKYCSKMFKIWSANSPEIYSKIRNRYYEKHKDRILAQQKERYQKIKNNRKTPEKDE